MLHIIQHFNWDIPLDLKISRIDTAILIVRFRRSRTFVNTYAHFKKTVPRLFLNCKSIADLL